MLVVEENPTMLGIIIGTTIAFGTCGFVRRHRGYTRTHWHHGHHCARAGRRRHGWDRDPDWRRGPDFRSRGAARWVAMLADRIDASPEQEDVIHDALHELMRELRGLKSDAKATRGDLGDAFGAESLDEERLGALFARHDELLGGARKAVVGALAKIHDALEPDQREQLSRWIGRRSFGPHRM